MVTTLFFKRHGKVLDLDSLWARLRVHVSIVGSMNNPRNTVSCFMLAVKFYRRQRYVWRIKWSLMTFYGNWSIFEKGLFTGIFPIRFSPKLKYCNFVIPFWHPNNARKTTYAFFHRINSLFRQVLFPHDERFLKKDLAVNKDRCTQKPDEAAHLMLL